MSKFSRRSFLGGSAAVAGGLPVADHLRFLEPSTGQRRAQAAVETKTSS